MALTLRDEKSGLIDRVRESLLGIGVLVLVGGVIVGAVVGGVVLLHALRSTEKRMAPLPIAQKSSPPAEVPAVLQIPVPPPPPGPGSATPISVAAPPAEIPAIDAEGFLRHWLVLGPFPFEKAQPGKQELARRHVHDEGKNRAEAGQKVSVGGREYAWKPHRTPEFFIDFRALLGGERGEDATAYAVCYLLSDEEVKGVRFRMGSNDQAKVYLNGREVLEFGETRTLQKDQNISEEVKIRKGENSVLFKVVNEKQGWQGCLRLTDRSGSPVRGLRVSLTPP
jgi:hypothetical protein